MSPCSLASDTPRRCRDDPGPDWRRVGASWQRLVVQPGERRREYRSIHRRRAGAKPDRWRRLRLRQSACPFGLNPANPSRGVGFSSELRNETALFTRCPFRFHRISKRARPGVKFRAGQGFDLKNHNRGEWRRLFLLSIPKVYVPVLELDNGERLTKGHDRPVHIADLKPRTRSCTCSRIVRALSPAEVAGVHHPEVHPLFNRQRRRTGQYACRAGRPFPIASHLNRDNYLLGKQFPRWLTGISTPFSTWGQWVGVDISQWPSLAALSTRRQPAEREAPPARQTGKELTRLVTHGVPGRVIARCPQPNRALMKPKSLAHQPVLFLSPQLADGGPFSAAMSSARSGRELAHRAWRRRQRRSSPSRRTGTRLPIVSGSAQAGDGSTTLAASPRNSPACTLPGAGARQTLAHHQDQVTQAGHCSGYRCRSPGVDPAPVPGCRFLTLFPEGRRPGGAAFPIQPEERCAPPLRP